MKRQNKKKDCREWHRDKESQNIKINTFENVVRNLQVDQNKIIETIANAAKLKVRILIKIKSIVSCFYLVNIIYNKTNQRQYLFSSFVFFSGYIFNNSKTRHISTNIYRKYNLHSINKCKMLLNPFTYRLFQFIIMKIELFLFEIIIKYSILD